ncbi:MAG: hypothetical protein AAGI44_05295 [Pseudomonadota bacterium]
MTSRHIVSAIVLLAVIVAASLFKRDERSVPVEQPLATAPPDIPRTAFSLSRDGIAPIESFGVITLPPGRGENALRPKADFAHRHADTDIFMSDYDDLSVPLAELREAAKSDASGVSDYKAYRILHHCAEAPRNEAELDAAMPELEKFALMQGMSNGQIMQGIDWYRQHYRQCQNVDSDAIAEWHTYLRGAANKGVPQAQIALSYFWPFSAPDWTEAEIADYVVMARDQLMRARDACSHEAFAYLSSTYVDPYSKEDENSLVEAYANLYAEQLILERQYENADLKLSGTRLYLEDMAQQMTSDELTAAKARGDDYYHRYCN